MKISPSTWVFGSKRITAAASEIGTVHIRADGEAVLYISFDTFERAKIVADAINALDIRPNCTLYAAPNYPYDTDDEEATAGRGANPTDTRTEVDEEIPF